MKDYKCLQCGHLSTANDLWVCPFCNSIHLIEQVRVSYSEQAKNGKRWCYDCTNHYFDRMCGYNAHMCKIHGSLDVDQTERHPDKTADTCKDYCERSGLKWYEKYGVK